MTLIAMIIGLKTRKWFLAAELYIQYACKWADEKGRVGQNESWKHLKMKCLSSLLLFCPSLALPEMVTVPFTVA